LVSSSCPDKNGQLFDFIEDDFPNKVDMTPTIFEYNANLLGSRWLTYSEIEDLYKKHKILNSSEKIILHAQEFNV